MQQLTYAPDNRSNWLPVIHFPFEQLRKTKSEGPTGGSPLTLRRSTRRGCFHIIAKHLTANAKSERKEVAIIGTNTANATTIDTTAQTKIGLREPDGQHATTVQYNDGPHDVASFS